MHCSALPFQLCPGLALNLSCTDPGSDIHALAQYPTSNLNLQDLPRIFPSMNCPDWPSPCIACRLGYELEFIHKLIRIELFSASVMTWFKSIFSENDWVSSWIEAVESVVESKRFRGKHLSLEFIWFVSRKIYFNCKLKKHYFNRISRHSAGHGSSFEKGQLSTIKVKSMSSIHISQSWIMRRFRIDVFRLSHELI